MPKSNILTLPPLYEITKQAITTKSINVEKLMGHSVGISDSYYKISESQLLEEYLKAVDALTIGENDILRRQVSELSNNPCQFLS